MGANIEVCGASIEVWKANIKVGGINIGHKKAMLQTSAPFLRLCGPGGFKKKSVGLALIQVVLRQSEVDLRKSQVEKVQVSSH